MKKMVIASCLTIGITLSINAAKKHSEIIETSSRETATGHKASREEKVIEVLTNTEDPNTILKVATEEAKAVEAETKASQEKGKATTIWEKFKEKSGLERVANWASKYSSQIKAFSAGVVITLTAALVYSNRQNNKARERNSLLIQRNEKLNSDKAELIMKYGTARELQATYNLYATRENANALKSKQSKETFQRLKEAVTERSKKEDREFDYTFTELGMIDLRKKKQPENK